MLSKPSETMESSDTDNPTKLCESLTNTTSSTPSEALWVNDTGVARLSDIILNQLQIDQQNRAAWGEEMSDPNPQYEDTAFQVIPLVKPL